MQPRTELDFWAAITHCWLVCYISATSVPKDTIFPAFRWLRYRHIYWIFFLTIMSLNPLKVISSSHSSYTIAPPPMKTKQNSSTNLKDTLRLE
uniref:Uncharacterized protein n=1 Tax=Falco tinnunculus TaxID=100819 RepID=A0A8C4UH64_FALTI